MFLSSLASLWIKVQLTTLGLRARFPTFSTGSGINRGHLQMTRCLFVKSSVFPWVPNGLRLSSPTYFGNGQGVREMTLRPNWLDDPPRFEPGILQQTCCVLVNEYN
ncbi:hypothetical protein AVEN_215333-1 [Araneus ventricosus]|uniref:Uncharacterized protein n=1 Tax=Araneus ventricosus TaxID=182803 RepID=A0A4Y2GFX4_ARAVE|nr:hypothetical protein AVEN_215333-1 [Araneus ventricosus]